MEDYDFTRETKVFHIVRGCKSRKLNALGHPRTFFSFFFSPRLTAHGSNHLSCVRIHRVSDKTPSPPSIACIVKIRFLSYIIRLYIIRFLSVPFIYRSPHSLFGEINTMGRLIARGTIKLLGDCRFNYARIIFSRCQN